jgi:DNA polymerase-3 subunit beta
MKIICTKENLRKALNLTSKIISSTTTLPILNNLLLKTEAGQLKISSTNLEVAIKTWVGGQIENPGEITVPAKTMADFVNNTTEDKITLESQKTDLLIKTSSTESVLKGLPAEDFPLIPEIKPIATVSLKTQELIEALSQISFATAFSETQPELAGVLFYFQGNHLRLAATDRYRLAEKALDLTKPLEQELKIIVPNRAVGELQRMLSDGGEQTEIMLSDNQVLFHSGATELISRIIEGQYPDYQQIIPREFASKILVNTQELISALKLTGLFAQDNNSVEMEALKAEKSLVLNAVSQKYGSNITRVPAQITGEDNRIIFNYRYILDCLNHLQQDKVELRLINSTSPAMIVPKEDPSYLYLVQPIKT